MIKIKHFYNYQSSNNSRVYRLGMLCLYSYTYTTYVDKGNDFLNKIICSYSSGMPYTNIVPIIILVVILSPDMMNN